MSSDYVFDLDAGRACLDFANTLVESSGEHLNSYADLVAFAEQSKLLDPVDAAWLRTEGSRDQATAESVMERARPLRGAIAGIFSAVASGRTPSEDDVANLNFEISQSLMHTRVRFGTRGEVNVVFGNRDLGAPLWSICRSAFDLLTSDTDLHKVRQCGGSDCNWLFLDTSKNSTRQWCSMQSCGNREKARRHYARQRRVLLNKA